MSNPLHIQQIATRLIALHGAEARAYAAQKADEMLAAGKLYERRTWRRVQEEVERAMGRDLLGDFPGLAAGLYGDRAEAGGPFAPNNLSSNNLSPKSVASESRTGDTLALSTKWMSS